MSVADVLLQDILDQAKITNTNLAALLRQSAGSGGGGGGGGGPNPIVQNIGKFNILNGVLTGIASVGNLVSNVFSSIFNFAGKLAGEFVTLAQKAFEGTAKFSDLFGAAERITRAIPLLGAAIAPVIGLFQKFVAYQEELLGQYRSLTKSGASFGGSLVEMRLAASRAYMKLEDFSKIVGTNSEVFSTAIGGVDAGIKIFTAAQNKLVDPNGPFGKNLMGLGVTAEEAGEMLSALMSVQGNVNKLNRMSSAEMAASTSQLVTNLDAYSKLTGENREALAKEMKSKLLDQQMQAFLSAMDPKEAMLAQEKINLALKIGGKGLEDNVKVMLLSGGKIQHAGTQAADDLMVSTRGMSAAAARQLVAAKSSQELMTNATQSMSTMAQGTKGFFNALGGPGFAGAMSATGAQFKLSTEQLKTYNKFQDQTVTTEQKLQQAREQQKQQFEGTAASLAAAQMQLKIFGNQIGEKFFKIIEPLNGPIMRVGNLLMDAFGGAIDFLTKSGGPMDKLGSVINEYLIPAIDWAANWFKETFVSLADSKTATDFFGRLFDRFAIVWNKISEVLGPPLRKFWEETAKPMIAEVFKNMIDWFISALRKNSRIARFLFNETDSEKEERTKMENDPIYQALRMQAEESARQVNVGAGEFQAGGGIDEEELKRQYLEEKKKSALAAQQRSEDETRRAMLQQSRQQATAGGRAGGSLGATGKLFENFGSGTAMELHGTEGVITPSQMSEVVANALKQQENKQLTEKLDTLTGLTQQLVALMQENANNSRRSLDAIQNLNGNLLV